MSFFTGRKSFTCFVTIMVIEIVLAGCGKIETWEVKTVPPSSLPLSESISIDSPSKTSYITETATPIVVPTPFVPEPLFGRTVDISAGPVDIPLEIQIPALKVVAPMVGVGITAENAMDAPKGKFGDPIWHTAFWYRGSSIPGAVGTATIAGHVNDIVGYPQIFAQLKKLKPGDLIIIHDKATLLDVTFVVDEVKVLSIKESSTPRMLNRIFGVGPSSGLGAQASLDGLAHLVLITCAGNFKDGEFDHHTVVFATRSD